jgi:hypothetical protein
MRLQALARLCVVAAQAEEIMSIDILVMGGSKITDAKLDAREAAEAKKFDLTVKLKSRISGAGASKYTFTGTKKNLSRMRKGHGLPHTLVSS